MQDCKTKEWLWNSYRITSLHSEEIQRRFAFPYVSTASLRSYFYVVTGDDLGTICRSRECGSTLRFPITEKAFPSWNCGLFDWPFVRPQSFSLQKDAESKNLAKIHLMSRRSTSLASLSADSLLPRVARLEETLCCVFRRSLLRYARLQGTLRSNLLNWL